MGDKEDCPCHPGNPHHLFRSLCSHLQQHCRWHMPGGVGGAMNSHRCCSQVASFPSGNVLSKFTGASQTPGDISSQCPPAPCSTLTGPYLLQGLRALAPSEHSNPSSQPQDPPGLWVSAKVLNRNGYLVAPPASNHKVAAFNNAAKHGS